MKMIQVSERRWKICRIPMRFILTAFAQRGKPSTEVGFIALPKIELPEGAKLLYSRNNEMSLSVDCVIEHESFSPVPEGTEIPLMDFVMEYEQFEVKKQRDQKDSPTVVEDRSGMVRLSDHTE